MRRSKSDYSIQTVVNALRALEAFEGQRDVGVSELSRKLGLHKNNVFRVLATLEQHGYIEQVSATDRYRLGPACQRLGRAFRETRDIGNEAPGYVAELAERLGESAHVAVREGGTVRHLYGVEGAARVRAGLRVGDSLPVHCTALGKVLIGCAPRYVLESLDREASDGGGLERRTDATIVDREKFIDHLRGVAAQGWALDLGEWDDEVACAAVPVFDGEGVLAGALSISGPAFRLDQSSLEAQAVPVLQEVAQRLSKSLGAHS